MDKVTFSVVIPHYNAPVELQLALDSVSRQTLKPVEVVVVDDCSPPGQEPQNLQVAEGIRLKVLKTDTNFGGPAGPRNVGVRNSRAKYVAFLDADDIWAENHLSVISAAIRKTGAQLIGATIRNFVSARHLPNLEACSRFRTVGKARMLVKSPFATSATVVERKSFDHLSFNESPDYRAVEDIDLWQRLVLTGSSGVKLDAETVWYFKNPAGISAQKLGHLKKIFRVTLTNGRSVARYSNPIYIYSITGVRMFLYCVASFYFRVLRGRL